MWFVTKGRFEDARRQITALEAERTRLQAEVDRLNSYLAWRFGGAPTHPEIDPRPEWMKPGAVPEVTQREQEQTDPNDLRAMAIKATGSRNPRIIAEWISRYNESNFRMVLFPGGKAPTREGIIATRQEKQEMSEATKDLENALGNSRQA